MTRNDHGKKNMFQKDILPPTLSRTFNDFEFSIHIPPKSLLRELTSVFPGAQISTNTPLLVVPTFQKSDVPLLEYGHKETVEKDRLLLRFFDWAQRVADAVNRLDSSAWINATDPASGMAWRDSSGSCYSDVDGIIRLLHYESMDVGGCRVVAHPQWRFSVYPATLFTTASPEIITRALTEVNGITSV